MYNRAAAQVKIVLRDNSDYAREHVYLRAVLTLHNSWLEVKGIHVTKDYKPKSGPWDPAERGTRKAKPVNRIYPEAAVRYVEINNEKVDLRKFKKEA
jgi:hypothetical protein